MPARECSRTACSHPAVSTLTYVYEDSTAVLGPLAGRSEPHSYDMCHEHGARLTAPRGWRLLRIPGAGDAGDDLTALAQALDARERSQQEPAPHLRLADPAGPRSRPAGGQDEGRRDTTATGRHLHVVRSTDEQPDS